MQNSSEGVARRVVVKDVLRARYRPGTKPLSWDKRVPGIETVITEDGQTVELFSGGGQSSPEPGWELLLIRPASALDLSTVTRASESVDAPLTWTLFGIRRRTDAGTTAQAA